VDLWARGGSGRRGAAAWRCAAATGGVASARGSLALVQTVIPVAGGLVTALAWALATLAAARAARVLGPWSATAWVALIGMAATAPLLIADGSSRPPEFSDLAWLALAGIGYAAGMVLNYGALAGGKVPIAAPIASTEGAVAAMLAIATGEVAEAPVIGLLALVVAGIALVTLQPGGGIDLPAGGDRRYVLYAVAAATSFGLSLYAAGRASGALPLAWVVASGRVAASLLVALPLVVARRVRWDRSVAPFLVAAGLLEVVGYLSFAWGARESIAVTAVLSSQFAVIAAVGAHLLGERISVRQWLGVGLVALSVTGVTVTRL
jgi:inner membrane transporter RhtA